MIYNYDEYNEFCEMQEGVSRGKEGVGRSEQDFTQAPCTCRFPICRYVRVGYRTLLQGGKPAPETAATARSRLHHVTVDLRFRHSETVLSLLNPLS